MLLAFNSKAYCNFVALLITIPIPIIIGMILAIACGLYITITPNIIVTVPYTISKSFLISLLVFLINLIIANVPSAINSVPIT